MRNPGKDSSTGGRLEEAQAIRNLDDVRAELKFEREGQAAEFRVEDYQARDFRVPVDSPALKMGCYPRGEVPGVRLGVR